MSRKFRRGIPRAIAALAVFLTFFVLTAVLLGAEEESPAQGALLEDLPLSASLTLLAQEGDQAWLVFNGPLESRVLLADAATGEVLAVREGGPVAAAFLRGGSLILCETAQTSVAFTRLSPTLEEAEHWEFFRLSSLLRRFDLSPEGGLYAVDSTSPAVLTYTSRTGSEEKVTFPQEVQFLQATPQGRLYVCAGDTLYLSEDGSLAGLTELPGGSLPVCLLGEEGYLDTNGTVCRVADGAVKGVLQLPSLLTRAALYSGSPEGLALGESNTRLLWYSWDGEALDSCLVEGELQAVSPGLAVYQQDGAFYCAPTGFGQPEATPSPAPSPTASPAPTETPAPAESPGPGETPEPEETPEPGETPEPSESPEPGETPAESPSPSPTSQPIPTPEAGWYPTTEGEYLLAPLGATVGELRQFFWPQAVQVEKPDGTTARDTEKLATGMTVPYSEKEGFPSAYTLVVPGDCTGLGLGSDRDVQAVQSHLLGEESLTGPYLRAADLDNDGQVTVEDLVLFDTPAPTPTPVPTTPQPSQTE